MPRPAPLAAHACRFVLALLVGALTSSAQGVVVEGLGRIDFPSSGAPQAQPAFLRGVLLLHSFEYDDAAEAFREAQAQDPLFVLAYWGEALTHSHPIWREDDPEAARAVLARLAPSAAERLAMAASERERGLLGAVDVLFGEGTRAERNRAYSAAMRALHARFPDDLEIASLYALSILGTSGATRDVALYMRAAAVAEEVYRVAPEHAGALHYLIHSYDDAVHAPLGVRMARTYARIAPAAAHALHMPSHIWVALGMWSESVASNSDAWAAGEARVARKQLGLDERDYHSLAWLSYSYLQLGRFSKARELLELMARDVVVNHSTRARQNLAVMRAAFVVGTRATDGDVLALDVELEGLRASSAAAHLFATGLAHANAGRLDAARAALEGMRARRHAAPEADAAGCCLPADTGEALSPTARAVITMEQELDGLIRVRAGEVEAGLASLAEACAEEQRMGLDFGPPEVVKPAHELLGEVLLELGRSADARAEFTAALARAPRRALSLVGLARAGDASVAAELEALWRDADDAARAWIGAAGRGEPAAGR